MPKKAQNESIKEGKRRGCACKGNCATKNCGCVKKALTCTDELCKCKSCENRVPKDSKSGNEKKKSSKNVTLTKSIKITENDASQMSKNSNKSRSIFTPEYDSRARSQIKEKVQAQTEKATTPRAVKRIMAPQKSTKKYTFKEKLQQFKNPNEDSTFSPEEPEDGDKTLGARSRKKTRRVQEESKRRIEKSVRMKSVEPSLAKETLRNSRRLRRSSSANDLYQVAYNTRLNKKLKLRTFSTPKVKLNGKDGKGSNADSDDEEYLPDSDTDEKNAQLLSNKSPMKRNVRKMAGRILRKSASTSDLSKVSAKEPKNVTFKTRKLSTSERRDESQYKGLSISAPASILTIRSTRSKSRKMDTAPNFPVEKKKATVSKARSRRNPSRSPNPRGSKKSIGSPLRNGNSPNKRAESVSKARFRRNLSKSPNPKGSKNPNGSPLRKEDSPNKRGRSVSKARLRRNLSKSPNPKGSKKPNGSLLGKDNSPNKRAESISKPRSKRNLSKSPNPKGSKKPNGSPLRKENSPNKKRRSVSTARSRRNLSKSPNPKRSKKPNGSPLKNGNSPNKRAESVSKPRSRRNLSRSPNPKDSKNPNGSPLRKEDSPNKRGRSVSKARLRRNLSKSPNPKASKKPNGSPLRKENSPNKRERSVSKARSRRNLSRSPNPKGSKKQNGSPLRRENSPNKRGRSVSTARSRRNLSKSPNPKRSKKPNGSPLKNGNSPNKRAGSVSKPRSRRNLSKSPNPQGSKEPNGSPLRKKNSPNKRGRSVSKARSRRNLSKSPNQIGLKKPNVSLLGKNNSPNKGEKSVSIARSRGNLFKTPNPKGSKNLNGSPLGKDTPEDKDVKSSSSSESSESSESNARANPIKMDYLTVPVVRYGPPTSDDSEIEEELSSEEESQSRADKLESGETIIEDYVGAKEAKKQRLEETEAIPSTSSSHQTLIEESSSANRENPETSKPILKRKSQEGTSVRNGKKGNLESFTSKLIVNLDSTDDESLSPTLFSKNLDNGIFNSTEKAATDYEEPDSDSNSEYREMSTLKVTDAVSRGHVNLGRNNLSQQAKQQTIPQREPADTESESSEWEDLS